LTVLQEATDSRDRIYGILGLVRYGCSTRIFPDYTQSVCFVYFEAYGVMWGNLENPTLHFAFVDLIADPEARLKRHDPFVEDDRSRNSCDDVYCGMYRSLINLSQRFI